MFKSPESRQFVAMRVGNWDNSVEKNLEFTNSTMDVQTCEVGVNATCCCPHSFYPWIKKPYYDASMEGLNEQIEHFVEWVQPTEGIFFAHNFEFLKLDNFCLSNL